MKTPLHFDGHGVNDAEGTRIFKLSTKQWRDDQKGLEPEFIRLSNLFAAAPELLEALINLVDDVEFAQPQIEPGLIGNGQIKKARAAIAKAQKYTV